MIDNQTLTHRIDYDGPINDDQSDAELAHIGEGRLGEYSQEDEDRHGYTESEMVRHYNSEPLDIEALEFLERNKMLQGKQRSRLKTLRGR